jgi:hypothetical protein
MCDPSDESIDHAVVSGAIDTNVQYRPFPRRAPMAYEHAPATGNTCRGAGQNGWPRKIPRRSASVVVVELTKQCRQYQSVMDN